MLLIILIHLNLHKNIYIFDYSNFSKENDKFVILHFTPLKK